MTRVLDGNEIGGRIREGLRGCLEELESAGIRPGLATVLMSDDPASETYVSMKQRACEELGIESVHRELASDAPEATLLEIVDALNADDGVHGILVQLPLPEHVDQREVLRRLDPRKDVDGFHPENVGRLVAGQPRFIPCTPHGIQRLLAAADVETAGAEAVIVGRSDIVGKPMASLLIAKAPGGNATTTICHSRTRDLAAHTQRADILIAAAGRPGLIDGSMIADGATVIDVGVNRVDANTKKGYELVGDVEFESARERAAVITPVPGGVGPMTITMLMYNAVKAAGLQADIPLSLP